MKTRVLLVVAAAAVVATLFSCTRELSIDINTASREMTFTASFSDDGTKTSIQPDGTSVWWAGEESINVFTSSGKSAKFTSTGTEARATAEFTGAFDSAVSKGETFYAVYPYSENNSFSDGKITMTVPSEQTAVEGSFADDLFPSIAVSQSNEFSFLHVCGGFRFTLSQEGIKRIIFEAGGHQPIAGKASVRFDDAGIPIAEIAVENGHSAIAINAPEGDVFKIDTWYYIAAVPAKLTGGYRLSFYKDGSWGSKTFSTAVTVKRGVFGGRHSVDSDVTFSNHAYVDLGLPSGALWATCNMGASFPEDYGDYYAWGETVPKSAFYWNNYKWCDGTSPHLTKYNSSSDSGVVDNKMVLDSEDDVARINWGSDWHMPSSSEIAELVSYCTSEWTTVNGVYGRVFTSKTNGNSIFLPASGYINESTPTSSDAIGYYWTSSQHNERPGGAWTLYFSAKSIYGSNYYSWKKVGLSVRPVKNNPDPQPENPGPEAVDLGLSVKWAPYNVGATKPEEFGDYFAWGETKPKSIYEWSTYKWCEGSYNSLTKYNDNQSYGKVDNKYVLDYNDDAAHVNWGGSWRMPTKEELNELLQKCTWEWTSMNNVKGYKVTSNKAGFTDKSIFLPGAGYNFGSNAVLLWSSTVSDYDRRAYFLAGGDADDACGGYGQEIRSYGERYFGMSVRPVFEGEDTGVVQVKEVSLDIKYLILSVGMSAQLTATVSPWNATDESVSWASGNANVATVDDGGIVHAISAGETTISVTTNDGGKTATCEVIVCETDFNGHEYVDLGLSVKWATCNVGATLPEQYGDYYAWGETEPKNDYSNATYKYNMKVSNYYRYTKYNNAVYYYGTIDNKTKLELEDDAARANWGGSWRMPTNEEQQELINNCTWVWTTINGVNGCLMTSKKTGYQDKSIFIPASGFRRGKTDLFNVASVGYCWSSSLNAGKASDADAFYCKSAGLYGYNLKYGFMRTDGLPVRPVTF